MKLNDYQINLATAVRRPTCQDLQRRREAQQQPHDVYIPRDPTPGDDGHRGRADVREVNQGARPRTQDCIKILRGSVPRDRSPQVNRMLTLS